MIAIVKASLHRLVDMTPSAWLAGMLLGAAQAIIGDVFSYLVLLVAAAAVVDWYFGGLAANSRGEYSSARSNAGWQSKLASLLLILLVRGFEGWLAKAGYANTHGVGATVIAVGYFTADLRSTNKHIQALGGSGVPFLTQLLDAVDAGVKRLIPGFLGGEKR